MSDSSQLVESWIASFCSMTGHEYFAEVAEDFIEDDFNLTGLSSQVPHYKEALEVILDVEPADDDEEDDEPLEDASEDEKVDARAAVRGYRETADGQLVMTNYRAEVESAAELLYGLIHQRYITSRPGIQQMHEKYELGHFGHCPRVFCNLTKVLPVGCSDMPGQETVKLFCPSCLDVYTPPNSRFQSVDGAFFGTTFGCLFFMTYPELQISPPRDSSNISPAPADDMSMTDSRDPSSSSRSRGQAIVQPDEINGVASVNFAPGLGPDSLYEPRVYGFRVAESSRTGPRMKWLRMKPEDLRDLDEVARFDAMNAEIGDDEEDGEDADGGDDTHPMTVPVDQSARKKAPMRRRRQVSGDGNGAPIPNGVG